MAFERAPQPGTKEPVFTGRNNGTAGLLKKGFFTDLPRSVKEQLGMVPALHREAVREDEQTGLPREAAKEDESEIVQQSPVAEQPIARKEAPQAPPRFNHEAVVSYDARGKKTIEALPVGLDGVQRYRVTRDVRPEARTPPEVSREAAKEEEREEGSGVELPMQTKLRVSSPDDPAEREADEMADRVMTMPLQREIAPGEEREEVGREASEDELQTKCEDCEAEEKDTLIREEAPEEDTVAAKLQRKGDLSGATVDAGTAAQINSVRSSGGQPLAPGDRAFFEERMDADFSNVRVHTNAAANETASAVQARAFTLGGDIVFNQGEYKPETSDGKRLLAHELTHTIQQGAARSVSRKAGRSLLQRWSQSPIAKVARAERQLQRRHPRQGTPASQQQPESGGILVAVAEATFDGLIRLLEFPPESVFLALGPLGPLYRAAALGFLKKIRAQGGAGMLRLAKNFVTAILSPRFIWGYAKGFGYGFFVDGLLGPFIMLWDLAKITYQAGGWLRRMASALGELNYFAIPGSIVDGVAGAAQWIEQNGPAIIDEIQNQATLGNLRALAGQVITGLVTGSRNVATKVGDGLANYFVRSFSSRTPEANEGLGYSAGYAGGLVSYEILFAIFTAGAGLAVTAGKAGIRTLVAGLKNVLRVIGVGARGERAAIDAVLFVWRELTHLVRGVERLIGRAIEGSPVFRALAARLNQLIERVRAFLASIKQRVEAYQQNRRARQGAERERRAADGRPTRTDGETAPSGQPVPENRLDDFVQVGQYRMGFTPNGRLAICASPCQEARWLIDELREKFKGRNADHILLSLERELAGLEARFARGQDVQTLADSFTRRLKFTEKNLSEKATDLPITSGRARIEARSEYQYIVVDSAKSREFFAKGTLVEEGNELVLQLHFNTVSKDLRSGAIRGEASLNDILAHFYKIHGPDRIRRVRAEWVTGDNISALNRYLLDNEFQQAGLDRTRRLALLIEAIRVTWTGQQMNRLGFRKIVRINVEKSLIPSQVYSNVVVEFAR